MNSDLQPTGERVIEDAYHRSIGGYIIYLMHSASYEFAERYCAGKRVIDLGCGTGYGTARIATSAAYVEGVDVSMEAVEFARIRYSAPNLRYSQVQTDGPLPFDDESFDVVLSFQVIEHVVDERAYLSEARRVLRQGGTLIVITPDREARLLPWQKPWNRWHIREHSAKSLAAAVSQVFDVEDTLKMGAELPVVSSELRRYRFMKWASLPVTLPFIPEQLRQAGLRLMHAVRPRQSAVVASEPELPPTRFDFDERVIVFSEDVPHSLNLVLVAQKKVGM